MVIMKVWMTSGVCQGESLCDDGFVELWCDCYNIQEYTVLEPSYTSTNGRVISSEIGELVNLIELDLGTNGLIGEIPSEIGNLTNLTSLSISIINSLVIYLLR